MREYYIRFLKEMQGKVFEFGKTQIIVAIGAGVVTAALTAIRQQAPLSVALWSVGLALIGYLVMLVLFFIRAVFNAPVSLDRQRAATQEKLEREIWTLTQALSRNPHEEQLEGKVRTAIEGLNEAGREALRWLLDSGGANMGHIHAAGFREGLNELAPVMNPVQLLIGSPQGTDTFFQINPNLKSAVKNVLFPPDRPTLPVR
jgi:hypothetical protein